MSNVKQVLKRVIPRWLYSPFLGPFHLLESVVANFKYDFPAKNLNVVGITGTNGKTTTAAMVASILKAAGKKVGLSTTANFQIGKERWDNELNMTVTDPFALQALLKRMKEDQVDWVVLEVTSHSLSQHRVWGIPIHTAVVTNLTPDHLDYHGSIEKYAAAKAKLLKLARAEVVLNRDDDWFDFFSRRSRKAHYTFGTNLECDIRLLKANLKPDGSKIMFQYGQDQLVVELALPGKFNVYNALAAATVALGLQIKPEDVKTGLEAVKSVPGRMEAIKAGQKFKVIVDYAHAPDAFEALFESLRPLTKGRLIAVFGGAGERDPGRWPGMGAAAGAYSDAVIITDDEPHHENPAKIRSAIIEAARATGRAKVIEEPDRRAAIKLAFKMAQPDDTVLLLGLGHQKSRAIGDKKIDWDDREVARELLKNTKN